MKKSLLAAAVLSAVSFGAHADGVELYGILDVAVANVTNSVSPSGNFGTGLNIKDGTSSAAATSVTNTFSGMLNGGIQGSRWGIKGSEDIGNGLKAIFQLESGINITNGSLNNSAQSLLDGYTASGTTATTFGSAGSTNGELFSRTANVGLSDSELGTIKFGKNYVFMYDVYNNYDPTQFAGLFSATGQSGTWSGGNGVSENLRQSNSVKYVNKLGNINYGAMYKFGNVSGSSSAQSAYGFNVGYETDTFGVQAVYQGATDAIKESAASATTLKLTAMNTNGYLVAAKYKFNQDLTGILSYQRYSISAPSDPYTSTSYPTTYNSLAVGAFTSATSNNQVYTASTNISNVGLTYQFNPKLKLGLGYWAANNDAYTGVLANTFNYAAALLDYNLSKRTDVYAGFMQETTSKADINNQSVSAVGLRHKF